MGIPVSEERPSSFSDWGDDNPTPTTSIVEPPAGLQTTGWTPSQKPPAPYMNWLHWITNRWTKNLDVRAPRIPLYKWFVGEQSGAHFATLAAALASSSVSNGDWIYFSPSTANTTLATAITVNKSVKIFCEPGTEFTGSDTRAFVISANDVELHGAGFDDSWDGASETVIEITGARARVTRCNFHTGNTRYIDADAVVSDADKPILSQNFPHVIEPSQVVDMWEWETGRYDLASIANSSNNLLFSTSATWSDVSDAVPPAAHVYGRYWELLTAFADGLSLRIVDGNGDVWIIQPIAGGLGSWQSHVTLGGTWTSPATITMTLDDSGVGVVYNVFKNGASVANFSTFTTLSSGSMDSSSFRMIMLVDGTGVRLPGEVQTVIKPKRKWFRTAFVPDTTLLYENYDVEWDMNLTPGKTYRVTSMADYLCFSELSVNINFRAFNHTSADSTYAVSETSFWFPTTDSNEMGMDICFEFVALRSGLSVRFYEEFECGNIGATFSTDNATMASRNYPFYLIQEL